MSVILIGGFLGVFQLLRTAICEESWVVRDLLAGIGLNQMRYCWMSVVVVMAGLFGSVPAVMAATSVTTLTPLNFGLLAVRSNASVSTLRVYMNGAVASTGNIIPIGGAVRGEYKLAGFTPGVQLTIQLDNAPLSAGGGGGPEFLTVNTYETPTVVSDALGEATIQLGAILNTSGSGNMYADAPYSGSTQIRVIYWSPGAGQYVTHYDTVNFSATLQSAIGLVQDQALSFGSIAAFTDPVQKASIRLNTNGTIDNITSAGSARITPLGVGAQAGVIRVTGAAPSCSVAITPEPGSVLLSHTVFGAGAARLVAKNFVTLPAGTGNTDATGDLQIKIGATLETEVTANTYAAGTYSGTYTLTVTY